MQIAFQDYKRHEEDNIDDSFDHARDDDGIEETDVMDANIGDFQICEDDGTDAVEDIQWSRTYQNDDPVQDYEEDINVPVPPTVAVDAEYEQAPELALPLDPKIQLNERQQLARIMIKELVNSTDDHNKAGIIIGLGGTGKSTVIQAVQYDVETTGGHGIGSVAKFAPTGVAANVIGGSTVHSSQRALDLPVGSRKFTPLKGERLKRLQKRFKQLRLVIFDEFSMLRQKELHWMDKRLQQIMGNHLPFGGVAIILMGDPGQLPPIKAKTLWFHKPKTDNDRCGATLYKTFRHNVMELQEVKRIEGDPDAEEYLGIMMAVRDGEGSKDQWHSVVSNCCQESMTLQEWKERFGGDDVTYLYTTNKEVLDHNLKRLKNLGVPIARIEAEHTGRGKSMSADTLSGLQLCLYLAIGAKVLLTWNLSQGAGLVNGSVGIVKDIIYDETNTNQKAGCLPDYVWVDFGKQYTGPSHFPNNPERRGWFPVRTLRASEYAAHEKESSRTMIPLRLSWAWTIWKAQGQTITGKLVANVSEREKECGLTYVAFSRVTRLKDLGIIGGFSFDRFTNKILAHQKLRYRKEEEKVLRAAVKKTITRLRPKLRQLRRQEARQRQAATAAGL